MVQNLIVALIVACAALYVVWRYMPQRWRSKLGRVHAGLAQAPGCGGGRDGACSSCGSCASGAAPGSEAPVEKPVAMPQSHRRTGDAR